MALLAECPKLGAVRLADAPRCLEDMQHPRRQAGSRISKHGAAKLLPTGKFTLKHQQPQDTLLHCSNRHAARSACKAGTGRIRQSCSHNAVAGGRRRARRGLHRSHRRRLMEGDLRDDRVWARDGGSVAGGAAPAAEASASGGRCDVARGRLLCVRPSAVRVELFVARDGRRLAALVVSCTLELLHARGHRRVRSNPCTGRTRLPGAPCAGCLPSSSLGWPHFRPFPTASWRWRWSWDHLVDLLSG
mmetsp:Transcript_121368/g.302867  ORF Transcript_121368/g.302867 Transcript_121368/m.302867 type:complete len:246 (-) Transcript_121368:101-838(-)